MTSGTNNNNSSSILSATLIVLTVVLIFGNAAKAQNLTYVDHACNENTWGDDGVYGELVSDVLDEAVHGASADPNMVDYSTESYGDDVVYGYGECSLSIFMTECYDCLVAARAQLTSTCGDAIGGEFTLGDCKIRYENYDFYPN